MKLFVAMIAACAALTLSQHASADPSADNVSNGIGSMTNGRQFNTTRTATSLNCEDCGSTNQYCSPATLYHFWGYFTNGHQCREYIGLTDGTPDLKRAAEIDQMNAEAMLEEAFQPNNSREAYWGYVSTTDRSPSSGRGNSPQAKLDACMGYAQVNSYPNLGSLADNSQCRTDCDSGTKNGYCNQTQSENGNANQTNAACKDRCDCWMNAAYGKSYNCEGL